MLKKNLNGLLLILFATLLLVLFGNSSAKAYTWDEFKEFVTDASSNTNISSNLRTLATRVKNDFTTIENKYSSLNYNLNNCSSFIIVTEGSYYIIRAYTNVANFQLNYTVSGNNKLWYITGNNKQLWKVGNNAFADASNYTNYGNNVIIGLIDFDENSIEKKYLLTDSNYNGVNIWFQNNYNPLEYAEFDIYYDDGVYVNESYPYVHYYKGKLYNKESIPLGKLSRNDSYYVEIRFQDIQENINVDNLYVAFGDTNGNIFESPIVHSSNDILNYNNSGDVLIDTRTLEYNKIYRILVDSYYDGGNETYEDLTFIMFLNSNAVISGESILFIGSGDGFTTQDSTNYLINNTNDSSEVESIIASYLPSGDTSGDVTNFALSLGYNSLENPFIEIIEFVLNGICDAATGTGNVQLELPLFGEEFVLDSANFETPTNILTTFIGSMLSALYVFAFYKYGFHVYESLQDGNVSSVLNSATGDSNINHM